MWSGREEDRDKGQGGCARWCDTDFVGTDGTNGGRFAQATALAHAVASQWRGSSANRLVVCTGGEPLLQLDTTLIEALHSEGFQIALETNGTIAIPKGIDWVCVSPKAGGSLVVQQGHELKLVYPQEGLAPETFASLDFQHYFLQPLDGPRRAEHTAQCVQYCLTHPRWRLSLQTHKYLGIP